MPIADGQIWWFPPYESCFPVSPGLIAHVEISSVVHGARGDGMGNGSVKGERINGLAGNASITCPPPQLKPPSAKARFDPGPSAAAPARAAAPPNFNRSRLLNMDSVFFI